jgi:hypothetical protein
MKRFFILVPVFFLASFFTNVTQSLAQKTTTKQETPKNNIQKSRTFCFGHDMPKRLC